jgi:hypothetical protein
VRIESTWNADVQLKKLFKKVRAVPPPQGAPAGTLECVELVAALAAPMTMCFDATTHLRVFQTGKRSSPQGEVPYTARHSDWREVEGLKLPFLEETSAGPAEFETRLLEVKFDQKAAASLFRMPKPAAKPSSRPAAKP